MKRFYTLQIVLCSYDKDVKVVKELIYHCTEERMHEICYDICNKMNDANLTFDGTNVSHYYEVRMQVGPTLDELNRTLSNTNP